MTELERIAVVLGKLNAPARRWMVGVLRDGCGFCYGVPAEVWELSARSEIGSLVVNVENLPLRAVTYELTAFGRRVGLAVMEADSFPLVRPVMWRSAQAARTGKAATTPQGWIDGKYERSGSERVDAGGGSGGAGVRVGAVLDAADGA